MMKLLDSLKKFLALLLDASTEVDISSSDGGIVENNFAKRLREEAVERGDDSY